VLHARGKEVHGVYTRKRMASAETKEIGKGKEVACVLRKRKKKKTLRIKWRVTRTLHDTII
jgi:hypothetical protein